VQHELFQHVLKAHGIKCAQTKTIHGTVSTPNMQVLGMMLLSVFVPLVAAAVNVQVNHMARSHMSG
jgi:hypothetical protein